MECDKIQPTRHGHTMCEITECTNPTQMFCEIACPLKHGHNPKDSYNIYLAKNNCNNQQKLEIEKKTNTTDSCSNEIYVLLANYFRQLCMACENNLHCDAKNFSKCKLKSSKWKTCPRGFWTEEMWQEAIEKTKETK